MDEKIAPQIKVKELYKKFCRSMKRGLIYGLHDVVCSSIGIKENPGKLKIDEFWAIENLSFTLKPGDHLGVFGKNGCGKSTLLRLISSIYEPDKGSVKTNGKLIPLFLPSVGFHSHMSILENIMTTGLIFGMKKEELNTKVMDIINFADLLGFENSPLGSLSPGMNMRLYVSIALKASPEILLIDEVLSVGDKEFKERIFYELKENYKDKIIIIVSHNSSDLKACCNKFLCLNTGEDYKVIKNEFIYC